MVLSEAWHVVLDDPNCDYRRRYEVKFRNNLRFKKEHALLRKKEGLLRESQVIEKQDE